MRKLHKMISIKKMNQDHKMNKLIQVNNLKQLKMIHRINQNKKSLKRLNLFQVDHLMLMMQISLNPLVFVMTQVPNQIKHHQLRSQVQVIVIKHARLQINRQVH